MAIEKTIVLKGDTEDAEKGVKKVADELQNVKEKATTASKGIGTMKKAVGGLGTAFKALGIGIVVASVAALTEAFSRNQKIVDAVSNVLGTVQVVFTEITNVLVGVYENASKSSENFDALGKVLSGIITIALTPLKLSFYAIKLAIQEAQLIWEKSMFGDGDPETVKELTKSIKETKDALDEVGQKALDAGKDIVDNFGEAITEASNIVTEVVDGVSKISIKAAYETAKANTELLNTAELAAAQQSRLIEQYDRLAEKQRQIRDDESLSIKEREEANKRLGEILEQQEKAMLRQADLQVAAAQAQVNINNNIENQVALTDALANKEGVLAQIEGFRSEQIVNRIALKKEEIELNNSISDAEKERRLAQLEFEESQETNELLKLEKQRERLEEENQIILDDLERKRELYALGTQARVDAEQEYLNRKQEIDNAITENEINANKEKETSARLLEEGKIELAQSGFAILGSLAKEGSALAKGVAVSQAVISTYQGINKALAETTDPTPTQSLRFANAAAVGIAGFLNVAKILSTKESSSGGGSGGQNSQPAAPSFNLVQGTGSNQIAESIGGQKEPLKAYVVSSDVSSGQSLDRNIIENASIG